MANALTDYWLTRQNQGNNLGTGEGDYGPGTDWLRMLQGTGSPLWEEAQRYGYAGSMPAGMSGDVSDYQAGNPQQELFDWMQSSGYDYGIKPTMNGGQWNAWLDPQGQEIPGTLREFDAPDDSTFWRAALAAGALAGGAAGGYLGGGGPELLSAADAGIGAFPAGMEGYGFGSVGAAGGTAAGAGAGLGAAGGTAGLEASIAALNGMALPAAPGALGGWAAAGAGAAAFDPVAAYLTSGAAEGSTLANAFTGAGGAAGAVGAGTMAGKLGTAASVLGSIGKGLGTANTLANLGQAAIGLYGQNKAIGAMKDATAQSNEFNRYAFDTIRADNQPLVDMRNSVLPQIQGLLSNPGSVMNEPGYQFQFNEGTKALNNGAAARGMTYSGAQGKALQRYGNDYGATKLDQSLNRLTTVAGLGQVGSNSNNEATQNYANNGSFNSLNMGQGRGSAYENMAEAGGNALSRIFNPWQYEQRNRRGPR